MDFANFDLSSYRVDSAGGIPGQAYYVPDFVSEEEETYLLRQINNAPRPKWKNLANRRLQVWGGDLTSSNKLFAQCFPPFLNKYPDIIGRLKATGAFSSSKNGAPNHVIVNEYLPNQGIMPHEDGPSYHPVVATISLGSHTVFHYYQYKSDATYDSPSLNASRISDRGDDTSPSAGASSGSDSRGRGRVIDTTRPILTFLLEPRSLVITTGALYTDYLHGIDPLGEDVFLPAHSPDADNLDSGLNTSPETDDLERVRVANWKMLKDAKMHEVVTKGGTLQRGMRISLTCRDVERVVGARSFQEVGI